MRNIFSRVFGARAPQSAPPGGVPGSAYEAASGQRPTLDQPSTDPRGGPESLLKVAPRQQPTLRRFESYGDIPTAPSAINALTRRARPQLPKDLEPKFRALAVQYDALTEAINRHGTDSAIKFAKAQHLEMIREAAAGGTEKIADRDVWTKEEVSEEYRKKRSALKAQRNLISAESRKLSQPLVKVLEQVASELVDDLEKSEREIAEEFGVPYLPSRTLVTIGQLSWRVGSCISVDSPRKMLEFFETK